VYLTVEPLPTDHPEGFEFLNETVGGSIPRQFMPAIEKGVRQALTDGAIAGYPMKNICVRVYDGKYHDVDSKEIAFTTAGRKAFVDGIKNARPVLLEPYVNVEITVPARHMGDVTAGRVPELFRPAQEHDRRRGHVCHGVQPRRADAVAYSGRCGGGVQAA
jgi:elongation factor G